MTMTVNKLLSGIYSKFMPVDVTCSCTKCDSMLCFAKRHDVGSCSCENCNESKTCLFYNNRLNKSHSDAANAAPVDIMKSMTGDGQSKHSCRGTPSKYTSDAMTNTYERSKNRIEELKKAYLPHKNTRDLSKNALEPPQSYNFVQDKYSIEPRRNEASNYTLEICKSVLGSQQIAIESQKKYYLPQKKVEDCDCNEFPKRTSKARGYVVDLKKHNTKPKQNTPECGAFILESHWNTIDTPDNKYLPKIRSCDCSDCLKEVSKLPEHIINPPGYVLELPPAKNAKEIRNNKPGIPTSKIEPQNHIHLPKKNAEDWAYNEFPKHASKTSGYVVDLQKDKAKPIKRTSEGRTFILESYWDTIEIPDNKYLPRITSCDCSDCLRELPKLPGHIIDPPGYILELPPTKNAKKNRNNKSEPLTNKTETQKNQYLPNAKTCVCDEPAKTTNTLKLCVNVGTPRNNIEISESKKNKLELCKNILQIQEHTIETLDSIYTPQKNICNNCEESPKKNSISPGYIYELPKYTKELANPIPNKSCVCDNTLQNKPAIPNYTQKAISNELYNNKLDTQKNTIGTLENKHHEKSCACNELAKCKSDSPGYVLEQQKQKNTKSCDCDETPKNKSDSSGYVLKPDKYKNAKSCNCNDTSKNKSDAPMPYDAVNKTQVFRINRLETQKNIIESQNKNVTNCQFNELEKCKSDSPGYVLEQHKQKNTKSCNCDDTPKNNSDSSGYVLELEKYKNAKSCNCNDISNNKSDAPGHTFELQKYKTPPHEPLNKTQVFKINRQETQKNTSETLNNNRKNCQCNDLAKCKSDLPGYIFELQKYKNTKSCNCDKTSKNKTDSMGYVLEQQKYKNAKSCNCNNTPKNKSDQSGRILDLKKYKTAPHEPVNKTQVFRINRLETKNNTTETLKSDYENKRCECNELAKCKSDSPGYIFELQKYKNTSKNNSDSAGYVLELQKYKNAKSCNCNNISKNKSDSSGQILDLQKYKTAPHEPVIKTQVFRINRLETQNKTTETLQNNNEKKRCDCNELAKCKSDSPGYIFELQKYKNEKSCNCDNTSKNKPDSSGYVLELDKYKNAKSCNCNRTPRNKSDSSGLILDLQKYKTAPHEPVHKTQVFRINIPETQNNKIETLQNNYKKNLCECNELAKCKSDSPGYVLELQKYKNEKSCNCNKISKNKSDSPGYIFELQKYKTTPFEPVNKTQVFRINRLETQSNKIEVMNNNYRKKCECNESEKTDPDSSGYVFELQKYSNKPMNNAQELLKSILETQKNTIEVELQKYKTIHDTAKNTQVFKINRLETLNHKYQKKSCECSESTKNKSDSPGYVFELQKNNNSESCDCGISTKNKSDSPGFIFDLQKYKHEQINDMLETKEKTLDNQYPKKSRECNDPSANCKSDSPGYVFELPENKNAKSCKCNDTQKNDVDTNGLLKLQKHTYEPSKNTQELCKSIFKTQEDTIETLYNTSDFPENNICNCKDSSKNLADLPESLFEENTLEVYNNMLGTSGIAQENRCQCIKKSVDNFNTPEICKNMLKTQKNTIEILKSIYLPRQSPKHTIELCRDMLRTQKETIDMLKKIYLPQKGKIERSKNMFELCKDKNKNKVESLKNIYLPPRLTLDYTKKYEHPMTSDSTRPMNNNQSFKGVHNDNVTHSHKEHNAGTAMSSAEVMDMPYTELNDSVACKQEYMSKKASKLSKYDIIQRIKEAYKACSCKVCECIAGKPVKTDLCKCKPCECEECMSYLDKFDIKPTNDYLDGTKCPCAQCDRSKCLRLSQEMNKLQTCDCRPCDCIQCTKNTAKLCDCEACQCVECKPKTTRQPQTLVVAPVGGNVQRVACTCSPCDCIECGVFPLAPNVMHEMSTGTNRHALCRCEVCLNETCDQSGADSCMCERRNRVMRKPVEKDTHDYDIRSATIVQNEPLKRDGKNRSTRHDTIAMFAALPHPYPTFVSNNNRLNITEICSCEECECITCACKEDAINAIKSSQLFTSLETKIKSDVNVCNKSKLDSSNNCKCKPCECQICEKYRDIRLFINGQASATYKRSCVCETCDCLSCEEKQKPLKYSFNGSCKCSACECTHCEEKMQKDKLELKSRWQCRICRSECCFGDEIHNARLHPHQKGEVLTPATHQTKVKNLNLEKDLIETPSSSIQVSTNLDFSSKVKNVSLNHELSKHNYHGNYSKETSEFNTLIKPGSKTHANIGNIYGFDTKNINKSEILKYDAYMQCQERIKGKYLPKNNSIDNEISGSNFSGYSSFETKTSCHKEYGNITPISQNKNKSWQSFCNSSSHDYLEYLIQFPKSTDKKQETCLKDVMELDMERTIKLEKFNIISKSTAKHHTDKMAHDNVSVKENRFQSHKCKIVDSSNSNFLSTKRTQSIKQYEINNIYNETNFNTSLGRDYSENPQISLDLNNHNDNYKNHEEAIKTKERNQQQGSGYIKGSKSSLRNNENHKYYNLMQNFNEFNVTRKVFDFNNSEQKTASTLLPIRSEKYSPWRYSKQLSHSYFLTGIDILNTDEDYKRVQKTLKEAKEFSLKLMRLLETYEKANKEFESISEKLKLSHGSLFIGNFDGKKDICSIEKDVTEERIAKEKNFSEIEHEPQEIHLEALSVRETLTSTSILQEKGKLSERIIVNSELDKNIILQKLSTYKDILNYKKACEPIADYDTSTKLNSVFKNNLLEQIETHLKKDEICYEGTPKKQMNENYGEIMQNEHKTIAIKPEEEGSFHETEEFLTMPDKQGTKRRKRISKKKNYKKYSKLLKRTIIITKRISTKNSNEYKPVIKYCVAVGTSTNFVSETNTSTNDENTSLLPANISVKDTEEKYQMQNDRKYEFNQIMRNLDTVFGNMEEVAVSTSTDTYGLEKEEYDSENSEITYELEVSKPWPILKKKNSWNTKPCTKGKEVCIFPSLELEIKQAVQSISLQTAISKKKSSVSHHENKALANLQVEVKKLLDMPILQLENPSNYRADCTKEMLDIQHKSEDLEVQIQNLLYLSMLLPLIKKKLEIESNFGSEGTFSLTPSIAGSVGTTSQIPSIGSARNSCEALKVGFLSVRRVSDHTVLVKWDTPRLLTEVKGYELLVDGRAVQKIFSPSKSMAVVTCLPHTDKVLLTIRTITSSVSVTGHYPATTIIYRPRAK